MRIGTMQSGVGTGKLPREVSQHVCATCGANFTVYPMVPEPPEEPEEGYVEPWVDCGFCRPVEGYHGEAILIDSKVCAQWVKS